VTIPRLILPVDLESLCAPAMTYPRAVYGWQSLFCRRYARGLADAFRRIEQRIVLNPTRYIDLVHQGSGT
jgi:hypothetical protein